MTKARELAEAYADKVDDSCRGYGNYSYKDVMNAFESGFKVRGALDRKIADSIHAKWLPGALKTTAQQIATRIAALDSEEDNT